MFSFTKEHLEIFYDRVVRITAGKLGIADIEFKSSVELLPEIKACSQNVHNNLQTFFEAYGEWYEGIVENRESDRQRVLDLIKKMDTARGILIKSLNDPK